MENLLQESRCHALASHEPEIAAAGDLKGLFLTHSCQLRSLCALVGLSAPRGPRAHGLCSTRSPGLTDALL